MACGDATRTQNHHSSLKDDGLLKLTNYNKTTERNSTFLGHIQNHTASNIIQNSIPLSGNVRKTNGVNKENFRKSINVPVVNDLQTKETTSAYANEYGKQFSCAIYYFVINVINIQGVDPGVAGVRLPTQ